MQKEPGSEPSPKRGERVYLKQIELENFKSFGGKMTIPLVEGYIAVTGPNGSGKSNITDAILFVLGPKSSKAIRAGRLTDLIFDGGKSKNRAEYTKVSLVFDNTDRMISWDSDTVKLTRLVRFASDGENYNSYFYVNDQKSSMGEFDSLLTRARISADGYNMVQQGDVTRIVSMGNIERRRVVDSISGIASYDEDISKAAGEKQEAEMNLDRISIVIGELEKQLDQLEKDKESARKYLEAQRRMEMAKGQSVYRQLETAEADLEYTKEQISAHENEISGLREKREGLRNRITELEGEIRDKEAEIEAQVGPEYKTLKDNIESVKISMATFADRMDRASDDKAEQEEALSTAGQMLSEAESSAQSCSRETEDNEIALRAKSGELEEARAEAARISEEMSSKGGEHTELQERLVRVERDIDEKGAAEHKASIEASKAAAAEEDASRALASLEEQANSAGFEIKDCEWSIRKAKEEAGPVSDVRTMTEKILAAKRQEAELEKQEGEINSAIRRISDEYNSLLAEKKVTERASRGANAVTAVLEMRDKGALRGIHGTIMELGTVDPEYETALSTAAGGRMQAIVVDDDQVAADAIAALKKGNLGRATFLPLNKMMDGKPRAKAIMAVKDSEGYAIDLVSFDEKYRSAFWYVFGDTLVVKSMDQGRRLMGGIRIVTMDGDLIEASGAMVGGAVSKQNALRFGSSSQSRLDTVSAELRAANDTLDALRIKLRELRDSIREMDNQMRSVSAGSLELQSKLGKLEAQLKELNDNRKRLTAEAGMKKEILAGAERANSEAASELARLSSELEGLRAERTAIRDRIAEIAPAEMQERIQRVRDSVYELTNQVSDLTTEKATLAAEKSGHDSRISSVKAEIIKIGKKIDLDIEAIQNASAERDKKRLELDALRIIEAEMESGIKDLREAKESLLESKIKAEGQRDNVSEKIEMKTSFKMSLEAKIAITEENIRQLREDVSQIGFEVERPIPSEEELRRTIRSCETIMSRMGQVNLRAIEDYEEKKIRYDDLTADIGKLNSQIRELDELVASLNSKKKGLFMESYGGIDSNFRKIYAELSGGGEAFMKLEDEEDPFRGGLEINAKPKNGKLLRLESLSGGEKTLTALAFIFAIQEHQPSPFYVLDEVDMFLDSVNAEMVANRIRKSSETAQFLQVSLRKVTLALAQHLIGVTRQPNGYSKIIIQPDFEEVSKYESEALAQKQETKEEVG